MRTKAGTLTTIVALVISFGWGYFIGYLVLRNNRPNAWYDMDFSVWVLCALYAFIHLFIGKLWTMGITSLINVVEFRTELNLLQHWTDDRQMIFGSLWPVSVPIAFAAFLVLMLVGKNIEIE